MNSLEHVGFQDGIDRWRTEGKNLKRESITLVMANKHLLKPVWMAAYCLGMGIRTPCEPKNKVCTSQGPRYTVNLWKGNKQTNLPPPPELL